MNPRVAGIATAAIAAVAVGIESGIPLFVDGLQVGGSAAGWLPHLGTVGQTVVAYLWVSRAVTYVLTVLVVAAIGYGVGKRIDVTREYRSVAGHFAVGGGVGHLIGLLALGAVGGGMPPSAVVQSFLGLGLILGVAIATALQFALVGFAGAALAEFGLALSARREKPIDASERADSE